jgi:hypothetical protein
MCDYYRRRFGFIDHLQVVITNNYNTTAISTLYIWRFLVTAPTLDISLTSCSNLLFTDSRRELTTDNWLKTCLGYNISA